MERDEDKTKERKGGGGAREGGGTGEPGEGVGGKISRARAIACQLCMRQGAKKR